MIETLNNAHPQFAYDNRMFSDDERNIVIYVEDMVGNKNVYYTISRKELMNMQYSSNNLNALYDAQVIINNNATYTTKREVKLQTKAFMAEEIFITETRNAPYDGKVYNNSIIDYTLSEGDGEKIVYVFYKIDDKKPKGVYDKIFLDTTDPTDDAPTVSSADNIVSIVNNQKDSIIENGVETQSGIASVSYGVKTEDDENYIWYSSQSLIPILAEGVDYSFVTRTIDRAGREKISKPTSFSINE